MEVDERGDLTLTWHPGSSCDCWLGGGRGCPRRNFTARDQQAKKQPATNSQQHVRAPGIPTMHLNQAGKGLFIYLLIFYPGGELPVPMCGQ